ncbi:Verru_Chthon cassette protein D [Prosthecobacter fusiformis]|nr:Verru_Chthon cassette protein D [Prosthecobacter fusiformis]
MKTFSPATPRRGFTLIESLSVVIILSVLIALATPSMLGAIKASRLTSAGEQITGKIIEAHGLALTFSSDIELRLYKAPLANPVDGSKGHYLQLFQWEENDPDLAAESGSEVASLKQLGPPEILPESIAISANPSFSSLWNLAPQTETSPEGDRDYVAIRFRPDGSTDLLEAVRWHLTLVDSQSSQLTELPPNFYTIQIDPVTSRLEIYRPE